MTESEPEEVKLLGAWLGGAWPYAIEGTVEVTGLLTIQYEIKLAVVRPSVEGGRLPTLPSKELQPSSSSTLTYMLPVYSASPSWQLLLTRNSNGQAHKKTVTLHHPEDLPLAPACRPPKGNLEGN